MFSVGMGAVLSECCGGYFEDVDEGVGGSGFVVVDECVVEFDENGSEVVYECL